MSKFLIDRVETFRMDSEADAKTFVENRKKNGSGEVIKYSIDHKERKSKGEIIDEWIRLTIRTKFNDEREPVESYKEEE